MKRTYRGDNSINSITAGGGAVTDFDYTYDANKRKQTAMDGAPGMAGFSQTFSYDAEDRLTNWSRAGGDGLATTTAQDWTLSLVGDWNETTRDSIPEARTHNAVHEIESIDGSALMHDAKGNLTYNPRRKHTYTWDFDNRLSKTRIMLSIFPMVIHDITYRYDALGRRVQLTDVATGLATTYALSGAQVFTEYENGQPARSYVDGSYVDDHLAVIEHPSDDIYYYHNDHRYSVAALTNDTGAVIKRYGYDSYGKRDIVVDADASVADAYGHTGRRHDAETEIAYFRSRYYSFIMGSFLSRDPLNYTDGLTLYGRYFVANKLDPSGAYTIDEGCCCDIDDYIEGTQEVIDYINEQIADGQSSIVQYRQGLTDIGGQTAGQAGVGYVGSGDPVCYEEAVNRIEQDGLITAGRIVTTVVGGGFAAAIGVIGGIFDNPGQQGAANFMTLFMAQEKVAHQALMHELERIETDCYDEYGGGHGTLQSWRECNCVDEL